MHTLEEIVEEAKRGTTIENMYKKFGGFSIYIPKVMPGYEHKVISEFNGYNYALLATKYNVTENQIRKIIRDSKPKQSKFSF